MRQASSGGTGAEYSISPNPRELLLDSFDRATEVYADQIDAPDKHRIIEAWRNNPQLAEIYEAYEAAKLGPEIVVYCRNLPAEVWQVIYQRIALEQPNSAPNPLKEQASDGIGLYFVANEAALDAYRDLYPESQSLNWGIAVMPTKGGYEDSGVTGYVNHDLTVKGRTTTDARTNQQTCDTTDFDTLEAILTTVNGIEAITTDNYPALGAMLTYYASHLMRQEEVSEGVYTWCKDTNMGSSPPMSVGFGSGCRQVLVFCYSFNQLCDCGVRASSAVEI
jgi:hypothetical protein